MRWQLQRYFAWQRCARGPCQPFCEYAQLSAQQHHRLCCAVLCLPSLQVYDKWPDDSDSLAVVGSLPLEQVSSVLLCL